jgi:hypothetical protein
MAELLGEPVDPKWAATLAKVPSCSAPGGRAENEYMWNIQIPILPFAPIVRLVH